MSSTSDPTASTAGSGEADLDTTVEQFILVLLALFLGIFGVSLIGVLRGHFEYNPDAAYGLLLFLAGFQIIVRGKTPVGDFQRSPLVVGLGFLLATVGLLGSFIPGLGVTGLRITAGVLMTVGAPLLLYSSWTRPRKARYWWRTGGLIRHLAWATTEVYLMTFALGVVTLLPGLASGALVMALCFIGAAAVLHLVATELLVSRKYPLQWKQRDATVIGAGARGHLLQRSGLDFSVALIILFGLILVLLGGLLILVNRGVLLFSPHGQFAIILTIMAIKIGCLGQTPIGTFRRTWIIRIAALICAGLGIASAIVPEAVPDQVRLILGILNIGGGAIALWSTFSAKMADLRNPPAELEPIRGRLRYLWFNLVLQGAVSILFGLTAVIHGLLSITVTAVILLVYGILLFDLARVSNGLMKLYPEFAT